MGFLRIAATLRRLLDESGDPDAMKAFDLEGWLAGWMKQQLPELGGKTPAETKPGGASRRRAGARAHARRPGGVTVHLWRIASDTPQWTAEDMAGKGAAYKGSRWNNPGEHLSRKASTSCELACCAGGKRPRSVSVRDLEGSVSQASSPRTMGWIIARSSSSRPAKARLLHRKWSTQIEVSTSTRVIARVLPGAAECPPSPASLHPERQGALPPVRARRS